MNTQVTKEHYSKDKYASLERFISYFYQINLIKKTRASKILFIGVGDGVVPDYLKNHLGLEVVTYDFAEDLKPDVVGDVRKLPFSDGEFDLVVAFEVLEHIPFEDFKTALEGIRRVTKKSVIISVPYRHTGFEFILKFPLIRTIFKRDFLRLSLNFPLRYPGFESSGQHYWEIDNSLYKLSRVREAFERYFKILDEASPVLHSYQRFFILEKK